MENRINKFQYWYGEKMLEVGQIEFMTDGSYRVNGELVGGILRELTGLKDKNGKEIYEGDIVQYQEAHEGDVELPFYRGVIVFNEEIGTFSIDNSYINRDPELRTVIGNIYENPELLTNNK